MEFINDNYSDIKYGPQIDTQLPFLYLLRVVSLY